MLVLEKFRGERTLDSGVSENCKICLWVSVIGYCVGKSNLCSLFLSPFVQPAIFTELVANVVVVRGFVLLLYVTCFILHACSLRKEIE